MKKSDAYTLRYTLAHSDSYSRSVTHTLLHITHTREKMLVSKCDDLALERRGRDIERDRQCEIKRERDGQYKIKKEREGM